MTLAQDKLRGEFASSRPDEIASWSLVETQERLKYIGRIGCPGDRTVHYGRSVHNVTLAVLTTAGRSFEFFGHEALGIAMILATEIPL